MSLYEPAEGLGLKAATFRLIRLSLLWQGALFSRLIRFQSPWEMESLLRGPKVQIGATASKAPEIPPTFRSRHMERHMTEV